MDPAAAGVSRRANFFLPEKLPKSRFGAVDRRQDGLPEIRRQCKCSLLISNVGHHFQGFSSATSGGEGSLWKSNHLPTNSDSKLPIQWSGNICDEWKREKPSTAVSFCVNILNWQTSSAPTPRASIRWNG